MIQLQSVYPLYLNNKAVQPNTDLAVTDKFTGEIAFRVAQADAATINEAIAGAVRATEPMARLAGYERQAVLQHCVDRFKQRFDELAFALCVEAGKPIKDSEGEVTRLIDTFRIAAEESVRMTGEVQPLAVAEQDRLLIELRHGPLDREPAADRRDGDDRGDVQRGDGAVPFERRAEQQHEPHDGNEAVAQV